MKTKLILFLIFFGVMGIIFTSYFAGSILLSQVVQPFSSLEQIPSTTDLDQPAIITVKENPSVSFVSADLLKSWVPWVIKQASILIGALSFAVFLYAGIMLIIQSDNEEQLTKSMKMIIYGVMGIALAAFSYSIIANVLQFFS